MNGLGKIITIIVVILIIVAVVLLLVWYMKPKGEPEVELTVEQKVSQAVNGYDFTMSEQETVDKVKEAGVEAIPLLMARIEDDLDETRFIVYASLAGLGMEYPEQKEAVVSGLKSGLDDESDSLRVQAGRFLLDLGVADGIPVLIEELDNDVAMMPSEQPMEISKFAYDALTAHTEQDFEHSKVKWNQWWEANRDSLEFDQETSMFK